MKRVRETAPATAWCARLVQSWEDTHLPLDLWRLVHEALVRAGPAHLVVLGRVNVALYSAFGDVRQVVDTALEHGFSDVLANLTATFDDVGRYFHPLKWAVLTDGRPEYSLATFRETLNAAACTYRTSNPHALSAERCRIARNWFVRELPRFGLPISHRLVLDMTLCTGHANVPQLQFTCVQCQFFEDSGRTRSVFLTMGFIYSLWTGHMFAPLPIYGRVWNYYPFRTAFLGDHLVPLKEFVAAARQFKHLTELGYVDPTISRCDTAALLRLAARHVTD